MTTCTKGSAVLLSAVFLSAMAWAQTAAKQNSQPAAPLITSIQGPELFQAYCASCHGKDAKGNGPMAASLKTLPPDLTRISTRGNGVFPLARVQKVISGEVALPGGHGSREMPVWGPIFSQVANDMDLGRVRVNNLARYLRDMQVTQPKK